MAHHLCRYIRLYEVIIMYIEKNKNNDIDYLRLVKNQRIVNSKGIKTSTKSVVYNIGPLSRFDDGKPNYVERLKQSFKQGKPIIPEFQRFCTDPLPKEHYDIHFEEGDPDCVGHPKLFSHILIERILEELGMTYYFQHYKAYTRSQFHLLGFFRLLVYGRILNPASKIATIRQNDDYYNPILDAPYLTIIIVISLVKVLKNVISMIKTGFLMKMIT